MQQIVGKDVAKKDFEKITVEKTGTRSVYLDAVRVIACLVVIIQHAPLPGEGAVAHGAFLVLNSYFAAVCVPLFFMVSGALLLPCSENASAFGYLKKRIAKILFPTVCFTLLYIFIGENVKGGGKNLLPTLLSIPLSAQGHGVLWFMYTLTGLYLLVPVISPWLRRVSKRELEFYLILWLITLLYPYLGRGLAVNAGNTGILYYFTGYAGYFLLGHYMHKYSLPLKLLLPFAVLALPLPAINKWLGWNFDFYEAFWYLSAPVAVMTATVFALVKKYLAKRQLQTSVSKPLTLVSNLSFGIYLIHILVMRKLLYQLPFVQGITNYYFQTFTIVVLTFIISLSACYLISFLPFSQYIIGYGKPKQQRKA